MASILIVEDDEQIRVLATSILEDAGYKVVAATGADGSQALVESDQPIDVMFIDLTLGSDPEAGLKAAQKARESRKNLAMLYTTGAGLNEGTKALFTGPSLFLPKPYTAEQLTKSVAFLLLKPHVPK